MFGNVLSYKGFCSATSFTAIKYLISFISYFLNFKRPHLFTGTMMSHVANALFTNYNDVLC